MITKDTARLIFNAYSEIDKGKKLLKDFKDQIKTSGSLELKDAFGYPAEIQMGIPAGPSSQRLFNVPKEIAIDVIERHIEGQKEELKRLKVVAKQELDLLTLDV